MYSLYVHITPNNKYYVGITSTSVETRWGNNGIKYKNQLFNRAIEKYGWDNIKHIIVFDNLSKEKAVSLEKKYISKLNSNNINKGYNLTSGGEGSCGIKITDTTRKKLVARSTGESNPFYGKKHSEHTKQTISEKNKGKFIGGKSSRAKAVYCITNNTVYDSITTASKALNINRVTISSVCKGKAITAGGYIFSYVQENNFVPKIRNDSRWKPVMCIETNERFISIQAASDTKHINAKCISDCCNGKQQTAGKLHWKFIE